MMDIELTYFPIHGFRGLMVRMVLDLGEINHYEKFMQDWANEKASKSQTGSHHRKFLYGRTCVF